jgi:hypothetical protein
MQEYLIPNSLEKILENTQILTISSSPNEECLLCQKKFICKRRKKNLKIIILKCGCDFHENCGINHLSYFDSPKCNHEFTEDIQCTFK